jgi:hypothetical protein
MGAGYHGGFGLTAGARRDVTAVAADSTLVGRGKGEALKTAATMIKKEPGYTDVVVHGNPNTVAVMKNGDWVELDHRRLAKFLKSDSGYSKGNIRLISCSTGKEAKGFAQNLANKMGVSVMAPSDTLYIYPNGKVVIGSNPFKSTGKWITYHPERKGRK